MEHKLRLRRWNKKDCRTLYDWRMDPLVRYYSLSSEVFPYDKHKEWFDNFMNNPNGFGFILEDFDIPVAQIRFEKTSIDGYYNVSISTAPKQTRKGYGSILLEAACKDKELLSVAKFFVAEIIDSNIISQSIFEKNNFSKTGETVYAGRRVYLYKRPAR